MTCNIRNIDYIIKSFGGNNKISFDYKDYMCTIFAGGNQKNYIENDNKFNIYVELEQIGNEIETFNFNNIEDVFENIMIYGKKLKDIWKDVVIVEFELGRL